MKNIIARLFLLAVLTTSPSLAFAHGGEGENEGGSSGSGGEENDLTIVKGPISAISASSVTIGAYTFVINSSTEFEDASGNHGTIDIFGIGDYAKAKGVQSGSDLIATELELEDEDHPSGEHHSSSSSASKDLIFSRCEFPHMELVRRGIERAVRDALLDRNIKSSVSVKTKLLSKEKQGNISSSAALNGVVVSSSNTSSDDLVSIGGAIEQQQCSGTVRVKVSIKGKNNATGEKVKDTIITNLSISGLRLSKASKK
ncbi:MAG: hypothetical protein K1X79_07030 [Oligoflexia bacterium]|nr:hypothetical protein [Oligoflexia bacterium]